GDLAAERLGELDVVLVEGADLRALDVEGADHLVLVDEWHRQRAAHAAGAFDVERVSGRVRTEIALANGGDAAGDAVALEGGSHALADLLRGHALGQQRLEAAGAPIEQAQLDDVVVQQVAGKAED